MLLLPVRTISTCLCLTLARHLHCRKKGVGGGGEVLEVITDVKEISRSGSILSGTVQFVCPRPFTYPPPPHPSRPIHHWRCSSSREVQFITRGAIHHATCTAAALRLECVPFWLLRYFPIIYFRPGVEFIYLLPGAPMGG